MSDDAVLDCPLCNAAVAVDSFRFVAAALLGSWEATGAVAGLLGASVDVGDVAFVGSWEATGAVVGLLGTSGDVGAAMLGFRVGTGRVGITVGIPVGLTVGIPDGR